MEKQEAVQIISQALSTVKATIQEHNIINQAMQVLIAEPKEEEVKDDSKDSKAN